MSYENLLVDVADGIATITINRPQALNALNSATLVELETAFGELDGNDAVKVIILTGAGKAFVAGADISEMKPLDAIGGRNFGLLGQSDETLRRDHTELAVVPTEERLETGDIAGSEVHDRLIVKR